MNICALFIKRPVMTTLLMVGVVIFGAAAYKMLPVAQLPNVDSPVIQVSAALPGADPATMASSVATPLEKQFSTIAGVDIMTSTSQIGATQITLMFDLSRNIDAAALDVQSAIARAASQLPPQMPTPPVFQKVNPADQPILYIALHSPTMPLYEVDEYAETMLSQRISMINGVAQVVVFGAQKYAVRAQVDPMAMATRGIGINDVADALNNGNVNLPTGTLYGNFQAFTVKATGQLYKAHDYEPLIVAYRNGSPVRLQDIAKVVDSVENNKTAAWYNGTRSVVLAILRQPGTNTVEVTDAIKTLLPTFRTQIPASLNMDILFDRSESIKASVHDVTFTMELTLALVVLVIFLFLRNFSATVIPSLALPISVVATFAAMFALGFSLDNLSLMALTLSVGFVADDAIVMLENIVRHREKGEQKVEAALNASREIGFTIISMTTSLAAVFIPVLFMPGFVGRLLHEFAVTIVAAILVSGVVSLTLTPMLCSRFLRPPGELRHGSIYAASERFFNGMLAAYEWALQRVMRHPLATVLTFLFTLAATFVLAYTAHWGFLPTEDTAQVFAFTEAAQGISFDDLVRHQKALVDIIKDDPNVEGFMSSAGGRGGIGAGNTGVLFLRLKPRSQRQLSADEVIQELRPKMAKVPGISVFMQVPPTIRISGQLTQGLYQYTLQGPDIPQLYKASQDLEKKLRESPLLVDVTSDLKIKNPQVNVQIIRDKASALGLTATQIETALYSAYGTRQVSTIYATNNEFQVILELLPEYQSSPSLLSYLYVRSAQGQLVPLDTVAKLTYDVGPMSVNHLGQLPAVTISFNLPPGVALGDAVKEVNTRAAATLPAAVTTSFQGTAQAFQRSMVGVALLVGLAILLIYIVLGILYESFLHPLTILSGLPSAAVGALATLLLFRVEVSLYAIVGIIMLIGIVKKNAIMVVDFALAAKHAGTVSPAEAAYQGCVIRFRPIMMTTMAALMAGLPIAFAWGAGSEARRPLGLAVVGGLIFSQLITLFITPVIYVYMERLGEWFSGRNRGPGATEETAVSDKE